jgi:DNA-binding transcriptional regulator YhcF (GntR family)
MESIPIDIEIQEKSSVPLYHQIATGIRGGILFGKLEKGARLPSIRELAESLDVNPETVIKAYAELETDRLVTSIKGRGTYVAENLDETFLRREQESVLQQLAQECRNRIRRVGVEPGDFIETFNRLCNRPGSFRKVAVVECSLAQANDHADDLKERIEDAEIVPVLLKVIAEHPRRVLDSLGSDCLVATTKFHIEEVSEALKPYKVEPFLLRLHINEEFLQALRSLPKHEVVGIVAADERTLDSAGSFAEQFLTRSQGRTIRALIGDEEKMRDIVSHASIVIHSPECREEIKAKLPWGIQRCETLFDVDVDSIESLKQLIGAA